MAHIREIGPIEPGEFDEQIRSASSPVVIRGAAAHWPIVQAAKRSVSEALTMIERMDTGAPADVMVAPSSEGGRFFYRPDMRGFNFKRDKGTLSQVSAHLKTLAMQENPIGLYAGAVAIDTHLPALAAAHTLPFLPSDSDVTPRIWLGNATQIPTHFDLSDNFAIVVAGTRRFTLFPPQATKNLYVGPLNETPAGQPVSMVDPIAPDHTRYPRYRDAELLAQTATLEPGDLIYIPTLWWHHVEAPTTLNILVNYWHNDVSHGGGFLALIHAMLAIREQPLAVRRAWLEWFEHFVFGPDAHTAADHLPPHGKGVSGPASPMRDRMMREFLVKVLGER